MTTELDRAIALCEENGLTVVMPRDSADEQLRSFWDNILKQLRMASDIARRGAKLTVNHGAWLNQNADAVALLRSAAIHHVDLILKDAVVVREKRDAA